jgi:hypothetical protein
MSTSLRLLEWSRLVVRAHVDRLVAFSLTGTDISSALATMELLQELRTALIALVTVLGSRLVLGWTSVKRFTQKSTRSFTALKSGESRPATSLSLLVFLASRRYSPRSVVASWRHPLILRSMTMRGRCGSKRAGHGSWWKLRNRLARNRS